MPETLPANPSDPYRRRLAEWHDLYRATYTMARPCAPAYVRSWGRMFAGLLQAEPPRYVPELADPPVSTDDLSDLLDEGVRLSAGYGVVYLRPVFVKVGDDDAGVWTWSLVLPLMVEPRWIHGRLAGATVWDHAPDPRRRPHVQARYRLVIVEDWDTATRSVATRVIEARTAGPDGSGALVLGQEIDPANPPAELADHPYVTAARSTDTTERFLVPVVWEWDDGHPAPAYVGNEQAVRGLVELWDQEQDDATITRKRVAMSSDLVATDAVADQYGRTLARPGFGRRDNLLLLAPGMTAQNVADGKVEVIDFGDDLVQRDRIERRESAVLEAIGVNPQTVGRSVAGRSDSAAAKRADQQLTTQTIAGPARAWEAALSVFAGQLATLNKTTWPDGQVVDVREGLKVQPGEAAETARTLAAAQAASTRTLIATAHPTWKDDEIDAELVRMAETGRAVMPLEV